MSWLRKGIVPCVLLFALYVATRPVVAESLTDADPCSSPSSSTKEAKRGPPAIVRLERGAAIVVGKHVQRACQLVNDVLRDPLVRDKKLQTELRLMTVALREEVLAPIYREYGALRGQDLTATQIVPPSKPDGSDVAAQPSRSSQIGPATAIYLHRTLSQIQTRLSRIFGKLPCKSNERRSECSKALDISAEIGFAGSPIYLSYPRLWSLKLKDGMKHASAQPRTARGDEAFRKAAPPPGSVQLTPAASSYVREMLGSIRRQVGNGCMLAAITWTQATRSKGPNDVEWKVTGPGLGAGTFMCDQVPPDVVRTIDGLKIVFSGDHASRFSGKLIDREEGRLVLREK